MAINTDLFLVLSLFASLIIGSYAYYVLGFKFKPEIETDVSERETRHIDINLGIDGWLQKTNYLDNGIWQLTTYVSNRKEHISNSYNIAQIEIVKESVLSGKPVIYTNSSQIAINDAKIKERASSEFTEANERDKRRDIDSTLDAVEKLLGKGNKPVIRQ